jgi:hypothetical protein
LLRLAERQEQAENRKVFGLFLRTNLVGVGRRMVGIGPRSGTLTGTLAPMPSCAFQAHIVIS